MEKKHRSTPAWLMLLRDIAEVAVSVAMFGILLYAFFWLLVNGFQEIKSGLNLRADTVNEEDGVGRVTASVGIIPRAMVEAPAEEEETALWVYVEGEGTPPEWYRPDEPMAVEWYAAEPHPPVGISENGIDWNVESAIYGWDGHMMTGVELDLFSRIMYLEFWGASKECMNAGIDSILNLWSSEYFGRTLFETLSATAENGALVYTTYGYAYDWDYDYIVLEEIKALCLERFVKGPEYNCCFFQLYGFPAWAEPLYEIDSVYFSTFIEGIWRNK